MSKQTFQIGSTKVEIDISDLQLSDDRKEISEALCIQARKYAEVARYHAMARALVEELSDNIRILEADLDSDVRESITKSGGKVTEDKVKAGIRVHPKLIAVQKELQSASLTEKLLGTIVQAYTQRKDCVLELARNYRAELTSSSGNSV